MFDSWILNMLGWGVVTDVSEEDVEEAKEKFELDLQPGEYIEGLEIKVED